MRPVPRLSELVRPDRPRTIIALVAVFCVVVGLGAGLFLPGARSAPTGTATVPPVAGSPGTARPADAAPRTAAGTTPLVVSLTFDDGLAGQMQYLQTLQQNGLVGTFYVNTGDIGQPNYLTRAQLAQIAAAGDEIGGHTVSHPNLVQDAPDETARQICDDRATLTSWGLDPVSFAYPFGAYSPAVESAVRDCGYANARRVGGLGPVSEACPTCAGAEDVPAADPYAIRTASEVTTDTSLSDLEDAVTTAEDGGGGWVPFIFHHESCATCGDLSTTPALLEGFATWLVKQQRAGTLVVRTVGQVVDRPGGAAHTGPPATATSIANADLAQGTGTMPDCWESAGFGDNVADYRWTPAVGGAPASETVTMTSWTSGDALMLPRLDLGQCTGVTTVGTPTVLSARYRSTVRTQFAVYRRDATGAWTYWTSSPWLPPAADWSTIAWTTPPAPPGTTGVAAGLVVGSPGSVTSTSYVEGPPPSPALISPGLRGVLEVGAAVAAGLGLLGALIGLVQHYGRRGGGHGPGGGRGDDPDPRDPSDPTDPSDPDRDDVPVLAGEPEGVR